MPESDFADWKHQELRNDDERSSIDSDPLNLTTRPQVEGGHKQEEQRDDQ